MPLFFWFVHSLGARAEICQIFPEVKKPFWNYLTFTDKYLGKFKPYTTWKNKLIVTPLMIVTVVPRVLTLSVFFATCFPLFSNYGSDGFRSGLILFICTFIFYAVTFAIVSYVTIIKPFQAKKREAVDIWVTIMCHNDELSLTMSWVGCLLPDSELLILFAENSQIFPRISVIPILSTFMCLVALNLLVNNQLNSSSNSTHHCGT